VTWHWDSERGRRVRAIGPVKAWARRRDPLAVGALVAILAAVGLAATGQGLLLVVFGVLFAATVASSLIALMGDELTAADLTAPPPVGLDPKEAARVDSADQAAESLDSLADRVGDALDAMGDAAGGIFS
jgi:hypothetical protein